MASCNFVMAVLLICHWRASVVLGFATKRSVKMRAPGSVLPSAIRMPSPPFLKKSHTSPSLLGRTKWPLRGILDDFFSVRSQAPSSQRQSSSPSSLSELYDDRRKEFPEQYPATYELLATNPVWWEAGDCRLVRPLLKGTQLESRPLKVAYDAKWQGWDARTFHRAVDGKGAAVVLGRSKGRWFGGYNPKGWSGLGGARPSVAAFLFYQNARNKWQKLKKVGGGGLACAKDDPDTGIWLGADGLVIPLSSGGGRAQSRLVDSRLGTYFERGPEGRYSIVPDGAYLLEELKVLVGVYAPGEEVPYSGAVLDFTSG